MLGAAGSAASIWSVLGATDASVNSMVVVLNQFPPAQRTEEFNKNFRNRPAFFSTRLLDVTGDVNGIGSGAVADENGNAVPVAIGFGFTDTYGNEIICEFDEKWRTKIQNLAINQTVRVVGIYSDFETDENGIHYIRLADCRIIE